MVSVASKGRIHERTRMMTRICRKPLAPAGPSIHETLDVTVRRLTRPGEVEDDTLVIGPQVEITRDKLTAVLHPNSGRVTNLPTTPFKR